MYLIGLTGGISTGKSTVAKYFSEQLGVPVIDNDVIARKVVEPNCKANRKIREAFGDEVFLEDGNINRALIGDIIFADPEKRQILNKIVHPEIFKEVCWQIVGYFFKGYNFVIIDSPLLFESNVWAKYVHKIIVVSCDEDLQIQRLIERNNLLESDAKLRISAQMPLSVKCEKADFVIENSSNFQCTYDQIESIYEELQTDKTYWKYRFLAGVIGGSALGLLILFFQKFLPTKETQHIIFDQPKPIEPPPPVGIFKGIFKNFRNPDSMASIF